MKRNLQWVWLILVVALVMAACTAPAAPATGGNSDTGADVANSDAEGRAVARATLVAEEGGDRRLGARPEDAVDQHRVPGLVELPLHLLDVVALLAPAQGARHHGADHCGMEVPGLGRTIAHARHHARGPLAGARARALVRWPTLAARGSRVSRPGR